MAAYYNEHDEFAAAWLRNLIANGEIAPGDVDTRSIEDICPDDLRPYTQCHFFAGVGAWSDALRRVGWDDDRPIWTASCPCQPFSAAGEGAGFDDERHLWPAFHYLASIRRPPAICGEQVASKLGYAWLDLIQTDMEGLAYAFWPVVVPIAGVGGPNERHRTWWVAIDAVADADGGQQHGRERLSRWHELDGSNPGWSQNSGDAPARGAGGGMADAARGHAAVDAGHGAGSGAAPGTGAAGRVAGCGAMVGVADADHQHDDGSGRRGPQRGHEPADGRTLGGMADAAGERRGEARHADDGHGGQGAIVPAGGGMGDALRAGLAGHPGNVARGGGPAVGAAPHRPTAAAGIHDGLGHNERPGPLNGFWRDADWLFCTDGKWRPVEPGTRPLAYGMPRSMGEIGPGLRRLCVAAGFDGDSLKRAKAYRVGTLRGYGNMISPEAAVEFIESWIDVAP